MSCNYGYWKEGEFWSYYFEFYNQEGEHLIGFNFRGFEKDGKQKGLATTITPYTEKDLKIKRRLQSIFNRNGFCFNRDDWYGNRFSVTNTEKLEEMMTELCYDIGCRLHLKSADIYY